MEHLNRQLAATAAPALYLRAVEQAYRALADGRLTNPPRRETLDGDQFVLDMTARLDDSRGRLLMLARKRIEELGTVDAAGARALGRRSATLTLHHLPTGRAALLDAEPLTDLRTGAAAVWATARLCSRVDRLAIVGTGRVALAAARCADAALAPRLIRATSRTAARREAFATACAELTTTVELMATIDAALAGADALIVAVPSPVPILTLERLAGLRAVVAVEGDPRAVLVDRAVLDSRPVLADDWAQAARSGSFAGGLPVARPTLAELAAGRLEFLRDAGAVVVQTGLAGLDLTAGWAVWRQAGGPT